MLKNKWIVQNIKKKKKFKDEYQQITYKSVKFFKFP